MKLNINGLSAVFILLTLTLVLTASAVSAYDYFVEAENMNLDNEFEVLVDSSARGGLFVNSPNFGRFFVCSDGETAPVMTTTVYIQQSGTYMLGARTKAPGTSDDSFCIQIDNGEKTGWGVPLSTSWEWNNAYDYYLSAGTHTIKFFMREDGTNLDAIRLTSDQPQDCNEGYLNDYQCNGNWKQKLYQYESCETQWINWDYCEDGCSGGTCYEDKDICSVDVSSLNFDDRITEGQSTTIKARAKNTGDVWQKVTINIFVDGVLKDVSSDNLSPGETYTRTLIIAPSAGTHTIKVRAFTDCGGSDTTYETLTVLHPSEPYPPICDYDNKCESWESSNCGDCTTNFQCDYDNICESWENSNCADCSGNLECDYDNKCETWESGNCQDCIANRPVTANTEVTFFPSKLDLKLFEGKIITINIDSRYSQTFSIDVDGVPSSWLSYTETVSVDDEDKVYVYITPKTPGLYDVDISVRAQSEGREFEKTISMFVSEDADGTGVPITGLISVSDQQVLVGVGVLVIIIIVVLGVILLRRPSYW
ncbi:MAG: hypothetical protein ABIF08_04860 [Nanoarchaeota archaeon]